MSERPFSRYTREKTWVALYSQHINAGYAWVPFSATNNSIDLIRCDSPGRAQETMQELLKEADACEAYYGGGQEESLAPKAVLAARRAGRLRCGVVLARSHDYYHYSLSDHPHIKLVICGLHDSYLPLPVWEMCSNRRYKTRETAVSLAAPDFDRIRRTQTGHHILVAAYAHGDPGAVAFVERKELPERTRRRLKREKDAMQETRYQGRPMAFLTEAKRKEIGGKISEGLKRYHAERRGGAI
jgi:hypothetical protein